MSSIEARVAELGFTLPVATPPKGNYCNCVRTGNYIYTAGHVSQNAAGELIVGKVGKDLTVEEGYAAAQRIVLSLLATLKEELGDLNQIKRIVKLTGFVNCVDGFTSQPGVVNGASDLLVKIFGDKGRHARSAVGTNALPLNVAVEIEAVVEVETGAPSKSAL
ncbi:hypothetical protein P43SY_007886 [Pythium insidiosum]|uniref:Endoribonuclease L-PSP/chorismate mutase-like domain-containing protein n=1 Tax=Pythium insidiosum TaxID=114742 RepID=A0AAD5QB15_PYTIN|nr:hypothetical protein P43SY_007886 [Pythium insidiosum]